MSEDEKAKIRNDVSVLFSSPPPPLDAPPQPFTLMYSPFTEYAWRSGRKTVT